MENNQKWVNLSFLAASVLIAFVTFLLASKFSAAFDMEGRIRDLETILKAGSIALGALSFIIMYKNTKAVTFVDEVITELSKVTWPMQEETFKATIAVLIAVTIAGFLLWVVDSLWAKTVALVLKSFS